jgi:hypothetical protein
MDKGQMPSAALHSLNDEDLKPRFGHDKIKHSHLPWQEIAACGGAAWLAHTRKQT